MKVTKEYEESDIDLKENKLHSMLAFSIPLLSLTYTESSIGDGKDVEKLDKHSRGVVASFLNIIEGAGYTIIKKEADLPKAFDY